MIPSFFPFLVNVYGWFNNFQQNNIGVSIFATGVILSWGPCLTTCSFILFPYMLSTKDRAFDAVKSYLYYSTGRIVSYAFIGGIAGYSGKLIRDYFDSADFRIYINSARALLLFLIGLTILIQGYRENKVCNFIHRNDFFNMFLTGLLIGILPCIPLFAVLAIIIYKADSFLYGSILGIVFGLGTMISPMAFLLAGAVAMARKLLFIKRILVGFRRVCGAVLIAIALFIFITGSVLHL